MGIWLATLAVLGIALNIALTWPGVWRVLRYGPVGVSVGTVLAGFTARTLWSAYAVHAHDLALFIGQAPVAAGFAAIAVVTARRRGARTATWLGCGLAVALALAAGLAAWAPAVLTTLAIGVAAIVNVPQMLRVFFDAHAAAGVSAAMYWFTAAASATWLSYGIVVNDLAISAPHFFLLPTAIITAIAVQRRHRGRLAASVSFRRRQPTPTQGSARP